MQRVEVDEGRLMEVRARGQRIEKLLADDDLNYCFEEIRQDLFSTWRDARSIDTREEAHDLNIALDLVRNKMLAIAQRGKSAETRLERLAKDAADTAKRIFRRSA